MRCASPPESVPAGRSSEQVAQPDVDEQSSACRKVEQRRDRRLVEDADRFGEVAPIRIAHVSAMLTPLIFDERSPR